MLTFVSLFRWVWRKWNGPKQYQDKKTGTLMMLPYVSALPRMNSLLKDIVPSTDYALIQDKKFREWVDKYAKDEELFFKEYVVFFSWVAQID